MNWHEALKANFGTQIGAKDKGEIQAWEELLRPVTNSNQEITRAIQMAADSGYKPEKYHVTVTDLKKWVVMYRKCRVRETGQGNEKDRKVMIRFKAYWIKRLSEGASTEEMEENAHQQPLSSTRMTEILIEDVLRETKGN